MRTRPLLIGGPAAVAAVAACVAAAVWWRGSGGEPSPAASPLAAAETALAAGRFREAERIAAATLPGPDPTAALLAADAAIRNGRDAAAADYLRTLPPDGLPADAVDAADRLAAAAAADYHFGRAVALSRRILARRPGHVGANRRLAVLFDVAGRRRDAQPHLWALLHAGVIRPPELFRLATPANLSDYNSDYARLLAAEPDQPSVMNGFAESLLRNDERERGEMLLRRAVAADPGLGDAQANLGGILVEDDDPDRYRRWRDALPDAVLRHPGVWVVRGRRALRAGAAGAAARCFLEAVRGDPYSPAPHTLLASTLAGLGRTAEADAVRTRSVDLDAVRSGVQDMTRRPAAGPLLTVAAVLERLGRTREAAAWYGGLPHLPHAPPDAVAHARERGATLFASLTPQTPRTLPGFDITDDLDLSDLPDPAAFESADRPAPSPNAPTGPPPPAAASAGPPLRFDSVADELGVRFVTGNGAVPGGPPITLGQATGTGVAAFDFDRDGWPDLHFPQAGVWPEGGAADPAPACCGPDALYRNLSGTGFEEVAGPAGVDDHASSLGVAVGDFDADGFPDLYVAAIGRNVLLRNNGDGTFRDVTDDAGLTLAEWTATTLVADLNGDGVADLYDANYAADFAAVMHRCYDGSGTEFPCTPGSFTPARDRVLLGRGDGTFADVSDEAGLRSTAGRSLGVIGLRLSASPDGTDPARAAFPDPAPGGPQAGGPLDLFVANDLTPNWLWRNWAERGGPPRYGDDAVLAGLAFDEAGRSQACMGIAQADVDADGDVDLFVTNFHGEADTLYEQDRGLFVDRGRAAGLAEPTLPMLGFGTEFADFDLDGDPDLAVVNGHIDDMTAPGIPFRMRPQLFRNDGAGRFAEQASAAGGGYFAAGRVGRALVTLDLDRDGRVDLAATHLFDPAAVLRNGTPAAGGALSLHLSGVSCGRDGYGAVVTVETGEPGPEGDTPGGAGFGGGPAGRRRAGHLAAGGGFQSANEPRLTFALPPPGDGPGGPVRVRVVWPDGSADRHAVAGPGEYRLVQGRGALRLPDPGR